MEYNIENEEGILIQPHTMGKGNLFEIKKRKVTKNLLKITLLDEQEPSVQSADKTKAVQVWRWNIYWYTETWKVALTASLSENNYLVGSMLETIPSNNIWR